MIIDEASRSVSVTQQHNDREQSKIDTQSRQSFSIKQTDSRELNIDISHQTDIYNFKTRFMSVTNSHSIVSDAIKQKLIMKSSRRELAVHSDFTSRSSFMNSNDENRLHTDFASRLSEIDAFSMTIDDDTSYLWSDTNLRSEHDSSKTHNRILKLSVSVIQATVFTDFQSELLDSWSHEKIEKFDALVRRVWSTIACRITLEKTLSVNVIEMSTLIETRRVRMFRYASHFR